jgi:hypothetical protein
VFGVGGDRMPDGAQSWSGRCAEHFPVGFGLLLEGLSTRHASGVVLVIAGRVLSMAIDVVRREEGDGV